MRFGVGPIDCKWSRLAGSTLHGRKHLMTARSNGLGEEAAGKHRARSEVGNGIVAHTHGV